MVSITSLWLPIVLSAVIVFVASSIIHMVLPYHRKDISKLAKEDEVMAALRPFSIPPGDYGLPCAQTMDERKKPEFLEKMNKGPVAVMTVLPNGPPAMGASLVLWFVYSIIVGVFAAYITAHALRFGSPYLDVFRFVGCSAFIGYGLALLQDSIWMKRNWGMTLKMVFDALVYGLLTAGVFGWLWPR